MRSVIALGSVLFSSTLIVAAAQTGCSSSSTPPAALTPFDSGTPTVPAAGAAPGSVTVTVVGKGYVVSADGVPADGGPNGFMVSPDGGVDCPGACTAGQATVLYAIPVPGNQFAGWSVMADGGSSVISTATNYVISAGTGSPLTATFVAGVAGDGG
jgi:hypothetical protein